VSSLPSAMAVVGDSIGLSTVEVASILFPLLAIPKLMLRHASESDSLVVPSVVGSLLSSLRAGHGRERERERRGQRTTEAGRGTPIGVHAGNGRNAVRGGGTSKLTSPPASHSALERDS
jgi:hypothetical protein